MVDNATVALNGPRESSDIEAKPASPNSTIRRGRPFADLSCEFSSEDPNGVPRQR
jgi:hypothetical protein